MVKPDKIFINSFVSLPQPVVKFSNISLPSTNILQKSNLNMNYVYYWRFLNTLTKINTKYVENRDLTHADHVFVENKYNDILDTIVHYKSEANRDDTYNYDNYLNNMIPKTSILFNLIKSQLGNKLSVYDVVDTMEPYMIYYNDLTYSQFKQIAAFVSDNISNYKIKYLQNKKIYDQLNNQKDLFIRDN